MATGSVRPQFSDLSARIGEKYKFISDAVNVKSTDIATLAMDEPLETALHVRSVVQDAQGIPPSTKPTVLERVVARENFLPAWFLEVGAERARAVCKIETSGADFEGNLGTWCGTGVMISPDVLLTNHHVLNSVDVARNAEFIFNYQVDASGKLLPTQSFRADPDRLFLTCPVAMPDGTPGLDFTFVWVSGSPGTKHGYVPIDRSSFSVTKDQCANIIQHPSGKTKMVVLQENTVTGFDLNTVQYVSDTEPGTSGAVVFNNNWRPIALHHAGRQRENEGIRFSAIAAYLEHLAQTPDAGDAPAQVLRLFTGFDSYMGFFGALGREAVLTGSGVERVVNSYKGELDDVDLGSWNIEWFNRNYEKKLADVARVIVAMNLDIWALVETSPEATQALVNYLNANFKMRYDCAFSEPEAPAARQTTAVIWNTKTVSLDRAESSWPEEFDQWFSVDSRDFGSLDLEAVEGKVFDRRPGLFKFAAQRGQNQKPFDFYVVPLHLKAMKEGSKRRRMAAKIIGAAVQRMIATYHKDADWAIVGDYNAELASGDFKALVSKDFLPMSAEDETSGAFSYVAKPKSLIDHIFLSPNLARTYGTSDYFIVAKDREFPTYVKNVSDHRPVVARLSLLPKAEARKAAAQPPAPPELLASLSRAA